jgi:hypothetical protein
MSCRSWIKWKINLRKQKRPINLNIYVIVQYQTIGPETSLYNLGGPLSFEIRIFRDDNRRFIVAMTST